MEKQTLSNYGWIVIAVLVLAVMIALATPFGKYVENAVWNTTTALFETEQKALDVVINTTQSDTENDNEMTPDGEQGENTTQKPETVPDDEEEPFSPL